MNTETHNWLQYREVVAECSAINGTSVSFPLPNAQGPPRNGGGVERLQEPEVREDQSETVSSGHNRTTALMNSQQLDYLSMTGPINIQTSYGMSHR